MKVQEIKISPPRSLSFNLGEIWENRELLYFFVWRDVKVKYRQTFLGILWAVLQPLLLMALFYGVFYKKLEIATTIPYSIHALSGLIFWGLFSSGILQSSESLIGSAPMIRKIYFPRLLIPMAALLSSLLDFFFAFIVFMIVLIFSGQSLNWHAAWCFPLALLLTLLGSFGIGVLLAALNVKYRDFRYLLPFAIQLLFFGSQVVYSIDSFAGDPLLTNLLFINPLNGVLELFRYGIGGTANFTGILISCASIIVCMIAGLIYFKKTETSFADII